MESTFRLLDSLPTELVHKIASLTQHKMTLLSMRTTSHRYNAIFSPFVLPTFKFTISCSPRTFDTWPFEPAPEILITHTSLLKVHLADICVPADDPIISPFWGELARFSGVKSLQLSWLGVPEDDEVGENHCVALLDRIFETILNATHGYLEGLSITRGAPGRDALRSFPDSLLRVRGLQTLSLYIGCEWLTADGCSASQILPSQVRELLQYNPLIDSFSLGNLCSNHPLSIHDVFQHNNLQELTIYGPLAPQLHSSPLDPLKLRNLRDVRLYPYGTRSGISSADSLWDTLRLSNVSLDTLHTGDYSPALFNYLSSVAGMSSLSLELSHLPSTTVTPRVSLTTILQFLSVQAPSLIYFAIFTGRALPPDWEDLGISPTAWKDLPPFPHLDTLCIPASRRIPFTKEGCQSLLDFFSDFPLLHYATIKWLVPPPPLPDLDDQGSIFDRLGKSFSTTTGRPTTFTAICAGTTKKFTITPRT